MKTTEQIMALADTYVHSSTCSHEYANDAARKYRAALQAAIEALVQERDVLKHRSEHLASALADEQSKSDKLEIKLVDAAAECKALRDELQKIVDGCYPSAICRSARAALQGAHHE